jgi:hypothetical protein
MILLQILEHDLHRQRIARPEAKVFWIETPAKSQFLPAVVSSVRPDKFLVTKKLVNGTHLRSGVFKYDSDRLDETIGPLFEAAYELSVNQKWNNILSSPQEAFVYVQKASGTTSQPHALLVPNSWTQSELSRWAGKTQLSQAAILAEGGKVQLPKAGKETTATLYKGICKVHRCNVVVPTFLSRPDFVGMYTQIVGGQTSLVLHNVRHGIAFCPRRGKN